VLTRALALPVHAQALLAILDSPLNKAGRVKARAAPRTLRCVTRRSLLRLRGGGS
jgi:hypothetical protein